VNAIKNVVCFLLGNSPASEVYMPTFRNTLFHLHRRIDVERLNLRIVGVSIREKFGSKIVCANSKKGDVVGVGPVTQQVVEGVTGPTPTPSPSLLLAQAIFEPTFSRMDTPTILKFSRSTPTHL